MRSTTKEIPPGKYEIFDAIEIMLTSTTDDLVSPQKVDWSLKDFDGQTAHLVMDLDTVRSQGTNMESYNSLSVTFNDLNGTFMSESGKPVNFGYQVQWPLSPLVSTEKISGMESLGSLWMTLIYIALAISLFLAIFQGSLLSTWMMINSLQLIAHLPLISVQLPANAHYFILNFLGFVRLNFESINSSIDSLSNKMSEYELIADEDSIFSS